LNFWRKKYFYKIQKSIIIGRKNHPAIFGDSTRKNVQKITKKRFFSRKKPFFESKKDSLIQKDSVRMS